MKMSLQILQIPVLLKNRDVKLKDFKISFFNATQNTIDELCEIRVVNVTKCCVV